PLEALHFGTVFYFSGCEPWGWRLSNLVMEIASCFLLYLATARISGSRTLAFTAAVIFALFPVHDSTHYWAVGSCVTLSLMLYLASLWATLKAIGSEKKLAWFAAAYAAFALSIYGYEPFLPLAALNVVAYTTVGNQFNSIAAKLRALFAQSVPYAVIIGSLLVYQRYLVPLISKPALHKIHLDAGLMANVVWQGLYNISPFATTPFISGHVQNFLLNDGLGGGTIARLLGLLAITSGGLLLTALSDREGATGEGNAKKKGALLLMLIGALAAVFSYTIFGLNPEYAPTLTTILNRINTGGAIGYSLLVAGLAGSIIYAGGRWTTVRATTIYALVGIAAIVFTLVNWNLGKTWEISWAVQKRTFDALHARKDEFATTNSIILLNCPRYVDCAPVFDGTWDFEQMMRIALGRTDINGGVVSERMRLSRDAVQDVTFGFVCAEYPLRGLVLVTPGLESCTQVHGAWNFIDIVEREGTTFGLAKQAISDWRSQAALGMRRQKNGLFIPQNKRREEPAQVPGESASPSTKNNTLDQKNLSVSGSL
ncbi:MAG: hypothetical protein K2X93_05170, partial [Candidatus Obscuribacterales bacterium]|nr:hypothetical protein [Candidatus Obscuribacterales bacterium]